MAFANDLHLKISQRSFHPSKNTAEHIKQVPRKLGNQINGMMGMGLL
jgi:hypothetical protein